MRKCALSRCNSGEVGRVVKARRPCRPACDRRSARSAHRCHGLGSPHAASHEGGRQVVCLGRLEKAGRQLGRAREERQIRWHGGHGQLGRLPGCWRAAGRSAERRPSPPKRRGRRARRWDRAGRPSPAPRREARQRETAASWAVAYSCVASGGRTRSR